MSTALSWTELRASRQDLRSLLAFRRTGLTSHSRRRMRVVGAFVLLLTVGAAVGPAYLGGEQPREHGGQMLALLPSLCLGFLVLAVFNAVAAAGGREIIPREQAIAFPVSTTTDHLGALLLAPLNIAWIAQAWTLLGVTSYALGTQRLWAYELPILLWILVSTALAQVAGWLAEGVRRGQHGIAIFRSVVLVLAAGAVALVVTGNLTNLLDRSPTAELLDARVRRTGRTLAFVDDRGARARRDWASAPPYSVPCPPAGRCTGRCVRSCAWSRAATPRGRTRSRTS